MTLIVFQMFFSLKYKVHDQGIKKYNQTYVTNVSKRECIIYTDSSWKRKRNIKGFQNHV